MAAHTQRMTLEFNEIDGDARARVGGKGAQLAALHRIEGVPVPLGNVRTFDSGAGARRFAAGRAAAAAKAAEVDARLRARPDGDANADETARMIDQLRTFSGYREYPKFAIVRRLAAYKQALLAEADRLVARGILREREDCFFLRFEEFAAAAAGDTPVPAALLEQRRATFAAHHALRAPRVLTSEGEQLNGSYDPRRPAPDGALIGLAVSAGTIEGRARVILDIADADVAPGDILITRYTDPSWTPVFVAVAGLVTEVGGTMTHGAVIAREYGLPAIVGVDRATERIRDGQRIRIDGTTGIIELLTP